MSAADAKTTQPMTLRTVAEGLRFPEGPVALADGSVLVVEIAAGRLSRVDSKGQIHLVADTGGGPNGAAIGPDGACYICNNGGFKWQEDAQGLRPVAQAEDYSGGRIERVDLATGRVDVLYTESDAGPLKGPNDIVFDANGGFWFTDLGKVRARDWDRGAVYYAKPDGSFIREVLHPLITPNGIGLSPDGKVLYVAETQTGRLWGYAITAPGEIAKRPWPAPHGGTLIAGLPGYQTLDSLAVDRTGNILVATLMNGGISIIAPDGTSVEHVPMPDLYTTNICFGGEGLRTAYITLSSSGRLVAADWVDAGWPSGLPLHFLND